MNNLTIKGFINEMSYDLTMQELEALVVDYQDVIIDFVVNNQYNYKSKREFNELCEMIRKEKFFNTLTMLINSDDDRIKPDMAYVLYTATHFNYVSEELKGDAICAGYRLRECELDGKLTNDKATNTAILISAVKSIRDYEVTPFFRSKTVENVVEALPEILYNAYHEKYKPNQINENVISTILLKAIPDLQPEEIVTALCKSNFEKDKLDPLYVPFALRIQAFLYKVCGMLSEEKFTDALSAACKSINKYNERTGANETLMNKYLNYKLLEAVVKSSDKVPMTMKLAHKRMKEFKERNKNYSNLF